MSRYSGEDVTFFMVPAPGQCSDSGFLLVSPPLRSCCSGQNLAVAVFVWSTCRLGEDTMRDTPRSFVSQVSEVACMFQTC